MSDTVFYYDWESLQPALYVMGGYAYDYGTEETKYWSNGKFWYRYLGASDAAFWQDGKSVYPYPVPGARHATMCPRLRHNVTVGEQSEC